jgi:hypothetical protein
VSCGAARNGVGTRVRACDVLLRHRGCDGLLAGKLDHFHFLPLASFTINGNAGIES